MILFEAVDQDHFEMPGGPSKGPCPDQAGVRPYPHVCRPSQKPGLHFLGPYYPQEPRSGQGQEKRNFFFFGKEKKIIIIFPLIPP